MEGMELRRACNLKLERIQASLDDVAVVAIGILLGNHLLKELLSIGGDARNSRSHFHALGKGEFQVLLEVPFQGFLFLMRERVANSDWVLRPIIEAHYGICSI